VHRYDDMMVRLAPFSVAITIAVAGCAGTNDPPTAPDASVVEAGTDDGAPPRNDDITDDRSAPDSPWRTDGAPFDRSVDISSKDALADIDVRGPDPGELDVAWHDGGCGACTTRPALPPTNRDEARFWFSTSKILVPYRTRMRDSVI